MRRDLSQSIISIPDRDVAPAVVVYGGLHGSEGSWLLSSIPGMLTQNVIFVLPRHFTNSCRSCIEELLTVVSPERISSFSLCGYSRGGLEVYRNSRLVRWQILGLIDPSPPGLARPRLADTILDNAKDSIRCVYWERNWGRTYASSVSSFVRHLRHMHVRMLEKPVLHRNMPAFFFDQFASDFMALARNASASQSSNGFASAPATDAQAVSDTSLVPLPQVAGHGYYAYSDVHRQYGTRSTIATISDAARAASEELGQTQIGIGDISFPDGGNMPPHKSHRNGRNVDVRPVRSDGANTPVTIHDKDYSRERTTILVETLRSTGKVRSILFNDKAIAGVTHWQGHDNHLHVVMAE